MWHELLENGWMWIWTAFCTGTKNSSTVAPASNTFGASEVLEELEEEHKLEPEVNQNSNGPILPG